MEQSFIAFLEDSIQKNWDLDALTDYKGATLQYKDVARKIEKLHIIFELSGIKKGDKIAVCGRNSSHWGVTFLATITYGAVIVPILHEFKADNIHNIVNHSEARLLLVGDMVWENLNENAMPLLEGVLLMNDFTLLVSRSERLDYARDHLNELFGKKFPRNFRREHVSYRRDKPEELAVINYTSGTTSYSKGVMIPYRALWSNTQFAFDVLTMKPGDNWYLCFQWRICMDWHSSSCMNSVSVAISISSPACPVRKLSFRHLPISSPTSWWLFL